MTAHLADFLARWRASGAEERANADLFFTELCDAIDVPRPNPKTGDPSRDVSRQGCFILAAKAAQDRTRSDKAKRGTPAWEEAMNDARGLALGHARRMDRPPRFLVIADLGYCFDLYASFDGSDQYRPFPNARASRLFFGDLASHTPLLRAVFTDPMQLDPSRQSAKVTREVAAHLAVLAQKLENAGHGAEAVATFLMRCLGTMFAEAFGLLPTYPDSKNGLFTGALERLWKPSPHSFPGGIEALWRAMNAGSDFGVAGKLLRFNGGMFANPTSLPLTEEHLGLLLDAAKCNGANVEPAIFGTLLERALDEKERHALGAHYTPRAYVERLVRPTIEEPLRAEWDLVQAEIRRLVELGEEAQLEEARIKARAFHRKLCATRVLDPACGSGNFLYVALDLFLRLEEEVVVKLWALGEEKQAWTRAGSIRVTPAQFLGIEKKRWAKEIAELVLWIGYLQHHVRVFGKETPPPEPVLQNYGTIACRDAMIAWDREEILRDEKGKPVTRWDGTTTKTHPVTGVEVPEESATVPVYRYVNPRKAEWPKADFVVGNPPFLGKLRVQALLGEGYASALREVYRNEVPDSADFVMYWWHRASALVANGKVDRFGLVTTNSITQTFNRRVVEAFLRTAAVRLSFAIPDHPWLDNEAGAAVRIAMTVGSRGGPQGVLLRVESETRSQGGSIDIRFSTSVGPIHADLRVGPNVVGALPLGANSGLTSNGMMLGSRGFLVERSSNVEAAVVQPIVNGNDVLQLSRRALVIDFFGLSSKDAACFAPAAFQHVSDRVRGEREAKAGGTNDSLAYAARWWTFAKPRQEWRRIRVGLGRYIATPETSKHRVFVLIDGATMPEHPLVAFGLQDAHYLGVLSSRVHVTWALATGGRLGVGNDPRYTKTRSFDPFPFPACTEAQAASIRKLGEQIDAHRKRRQAAHHTLTITGMYNVIERLRSGEPLSAKEKVVHEQGLVSVLKQLHDDLDAAVFDAYGWPGDLTDEQILEKLVALNAERAEEEKNGLVRWVRPEFQKPATQTAIASTEEETIDDEPEAPAVPAAQVAWPKALPEQIGAIRDLVLRGASPWTAKQAASRFKGVSDKGIAPVLDSLAALGLVVTYEQGGERWWRGARVVG